MLPLIISYFIYISALKNGGSQYSTYGFLIGSMLLSGYIHMAWLLDWDGTGTSSSTSGLIFIFIPLYSLIPGGIGFAIGQIIARGKKT